MNAPAPLFEEPAAAVEIVTFGCRLNAGESDAIAAAAARSDLRDAVVFNTCAVTAEAVRQARQAIRKRARERPGARLIVTGCAAQIDPGAFADMPDVDRVLGNAEKLAPGAFTGAALAGPRVQVGDVMAAPPPTGVLVPRPTGAKRARAFVDIQSGCDHRCTFCVIPFGRGNARSASAASVVARVQAAAEAGFAEVVLTGVDLTSWGGDLAGAPRLGDLVARILAEAPELRRLRLSSIDAAEMDETLLATFAAEPRLMPHLHLSLQSGDDLILKRMKRRHGRAQALALVAALRRVRPAIAVGADLIAGFPTETDAAFANTLALVSEAGLAYAHVFPFSPRPGTPAARMPQVEPKIVRARARRLREAAEAARRAHLDRRVGALARAVVETPGRARDEDFTEIAFVGDAPAGTLVAGPIVGHDGRRARLGAWEAVG